MNQTKKSKLKEMKGVELGTGKNGKWSGWYLSVCSLFPYVITAVARENPAHPLSLHWNPLTSEGLTGRVT